MLTGPTGTGSVGRPTTEEGYLQSEIYALAPDSETVKAITNQDSPNTAFAYALSVLKDLWDAVAVVTSPITGVYLAPHYIEVDTTIPANYDGTSFSRGVAVGITVTVSPGSEFTVIDEDPIDVNTIQVSTNLTVEDFSGNITAELVDASKFKRNTGSAANVTIDTVANVGWTIGDNIGVINSGSGDITLVADSGVTFTGNGVTLANGGATVTMVMIDTDIWNITGQTT